MLVSIPGGGGGGAPIIPGGGGYIPAGGIGSTIPGGGGGLSVDIPGGGPIPGGGIPIPGGAIPGGAMPGGGFPMPGGAIPGGGLPIPGGGIPNPSFCSVFGRGTILNYIEIRSLLLGGLAYCAVRSFGNVVIFLAKIPMLGSNIRVHCFAAFFFAVERLLLAMGRETY